MILRPVFRVQAFRLQHGIEHQPTHPLVVSLAQLYLAELETLQLSTPADKKARVANLANEREGGQERGTAQVRATVRKVMVRPVRGSGTSPRKLVKPRRHADSLHLNRGVLGDPTARMLMTGPRGERALLQLIQLWRSNAHRQGEAPQGVPRLRRKRNQIPRLRCVKLQLRLGHPGSRSWSINGSGDPGSSGFHHELAQVLEGLTPREFATGSG